jgi:hypothetical protein
MIIIGESVTFSLKQCQDSNLTLRNSDEMRGEAAAKIKNIPPLKKQETVSSTKKKSGTRGSD